MLAHKKMNRNDMAIVFFTAVNVVYFLLSYLNVLSLIGNLKLLLIILIKRCLPLQINILKLIKILFHIHNEMCIYKNLA